MREAKPLTTRERAWIESLYFPEDVAPIIEELLAAEAFWREAVKRADWDAAGQCWFCEAWIHAESTDKHKSDCPWLRAQESE